MKKSLIAAGFAIAMMLGAASGASAASDKTTCAGFGDGWANHGEHVLGDYVMGDADNAAGGAILPGGPGPGFHFPNDVAPGASFCLDQAQSPGLHFP